MTLVRSLPLLLALAACCITPAAAQDEDTEEKSPQQLLGEVVRDLQRGRLESAIEKADALVEAHPEFAPGFVIGAQANHAAAFEAIEDDDRQAANPFLYRCAELMREYKELKDELDEQEQNFYATAIYNEACCLAVDEETEKAIEILKEAVEAGFEDADHIEEDPDFESLRDNEEFKEIIERLRNRRIG